MKQHRAVTMQLFLHHEPLLAEADENVLWQALADCFFSDAEPDCAWLLGWHMLQNGRLSQDLPWAEVTAEILRNNAKDDWRTTTTRLAGTSVCVVAGLCGAGGIIHQGWYARFQQRRNRARQRARITRSVLRAQGDATAAAAANAQMPPPPPPPQSCVMRILNRCCSMVTDAAQSVWRLPWRCCVGFIAALRACTSAITETATGVAAGASAATQRIWQHVVTRRTAVTAQQPHVLWETSSDATSSTDDDEAASLMSDAASDEDEEPAVKAEAEQHAAGAAQQRRKRKARKRRRGRGAAPAAAEARAEEDDMGGAALAAPADSPVQPDAASAKALLAASSDDDGNSGTDDADDVVPPAPSAAADAAGSGGGGDAPTVLPEAVAGAQAPGDQAEAAIAAAPLPPPPPPAAAETTKECVVCLQDVPVDEVPTLAPCGHRITCAACTAVLLALPAAERRCPTCREPILCSVSRVYN